MSKNTLPWLLAGSLVLLLACLAVFYLKRGWQAPPDATRDSHFWELRFESTPKPAAVRPFAHAKVTVEHRPNTKAPTELTISYDASDQISVDLPMYRSRPGNAEIQLPDGALFRLEAIAACLPRPEYFSKETHDEPVQWLDPISGSAVEVSDLNAKAGHFHFYKKLTIAKPLAKFLITSEGTENVRQTGIMVFNADNHRGLCYSGSTQSEDPMVLKTNLMQWHDSPLLLVVDVAYGSLETRKLPTLPGSIATFSTFSVKAMHTEPHTWHANSWGGGPMPDITFGSRDTMGSGNFLFLSVSPIEFFKACDFEAPGKAKLDIGDLHGGAGISAIDPPSFEEITVRARPHIARLVFEIPALTGLLPVPEPEFAGQPNLFDLRIPYVRVTTSPRDLEEIVEDATHFDLWWAGDEKQVRKPKSLEFRDVTPADLVEALQQETGGNPPVYVRTKAQEIQIGDDDDVELWEKIKDWISP